MLHLNNNIRIEKKYLQRFIIKPPAKSISNYFKNNILG